MFSVSYVIAGGAGGPVSCPCVLVLSLGALGQWGLLSAGVSHADARSQCLVASECRPCVHLSPGHGKQCLERRKDREWTQSLVEWGSSGIPRKLHGRAQMTQSVRFMIKYQQYIKNNVCMSL